MGMCCVLCCQGRREGRGESGTHNFQLRSDPNPNLADMEKSFFIHADIDNPNLIAYGCEVGYGVREICRI